MSRAWHNLASTNHHAAGVSMLQEGQQVCCIRVVRMAFAASHAASASGVDLCGSTRMLALDRLRQGCCSFSKLVVGPRPHWLRCSAAVTRPNHRGCDPLLISWARLGIAESGFRREGEAVGYIALAYEEHQKFWCCIPVSV